ncbi:MAG: TonB-dependent receptor [Campylobacterota bacterium]|nr:TonB-dependent receptor [Campylobacterota bacterium]
MRIGHLAKSTTLLCFLLGSSAALNAADAVELDAITVESSTIDDRFESKRTEVSSTAVRSGEEIEKHHAENIANVLNTIPGVTARINEGDSNKIHIRGIGQEVYMGEKPGVAIVIDGVPVQERAGSVNIDMDNIESIKVIKGGASYLYGNDALAGAVVITTKRAKAKNEGMIATEQGSHGYEKYLAQYNGSTEDFAVMVQGSYKASDGYWEDSDYWTKSINGKLQYYIDDTSDITFGADVTKRYENDSGSITAVVYDDLGNPVDQIATNPESKGEVGYSTDYDIDLSKFFLTYSKDFSDTANLMAQVYRYEDTTENKSGAYDTDRDGGRDDHLYDAYANTIQTGIKSELRNDSEVLATMIGLDLANNEEDKNSVYRVDYTDRRGTDHTVGEVNSDTSFEEKIRAIYGEVKYGVTDKLVASVNARYDALDYDYSNDFDPAASETWNKDFEEFSYRVGAVYKFNPDSIVYTSVSTGFRVPTIDQLYAGDILSGRYVYENNPDIDTEKTYNYEIGYRGKTDLIQYEVSVYQLNRDDMIVRNGGNYVTDPDYASQYGNFADVRNRGLELSLNSDRTKDLSFDLAYTYLDSEYTRYDNYTLVVFDETVPPRGADVVVDRYDLAGNSVPRISKHTVYLGADYKILNNWSLTAEVTHKSSQYADELNQVKVAGYEVYNLRTKYNTALLGFDTELFAKVDNVFDEQWYMMPRVTGDRNDDGLYNAGDMGLTVNPGRVFYAGLSMRF